MTSTEASNPFCKSLPTQLRGWDSTSLRAYLECPRKYFYSIVQGWRRSGNRDTEWGRIYHAATEEYDKAVARGASKEDATDVALQFALKESGSYVAPEGVILESGENWQQSALTFVPWDCAYLPTWRCTDEGPLFKSGKNKGQPNPAKRCVNAKKVHPGNGPGDTCPRCGKPTERSQQWFYGDEVKNRYTLLRAVVLYCEDQRADGVRAYVFPDGHPAVELSFQIPLPLMNPDGEPYLLCGHMDGIGEDGEPGTESLERFPREKKTTKKSLSQGYFNQFEPDLQIDTYDLVGSVLFPELKMHNVMLEATQTLVSDTRFQRQMIHNTEGKRTEHLTDVLEWIKRAEDDAKLHAAGNPAAYPRNKAACYNHGAPCPFREICSKDPGARQRFLEANYNVEHWNPLSER